MRQIFNFGNGEVAVGSGSAEDGRSVVVLRYLEPGKYKSGDSVPETFDDHDVVMYFSTLESIDVLIEHCMEARRILRKEMLNNENGEYTYGHERKDTYAADF
jgi:hypothetical protein